MVDLNLRLESSLNEEEYGYLSRLQHIELPEDFPKEYVIDPELPNKETFKKVRGQVLELLQSEEAIEWAFQTLIHRFYRNGYIYLEISLTPYLHSKEGLSQRRILNAAIKGLNDALKKCPGFEVNLILYAHREASLAYNQETMRLALEFRNNRVVAIGLEGDDTKKRVASYERFFRPAKMSDFPIVIELGESYCDFASIKEAINLGAKRIIFPYELPVDFMFASELTQKHIFFEYHASCDYSLGRGKELKEFPIKDIWSYGYQGYMASYAPFICNSDLVKEYRKLKEACDFKREDLQHSMSVSIQAVFEKDLLKRTRLIQLFARYFDGFFAKTM